LAGELFAPGCDQPTFTGTSYDLGIVAGLATSMCVEMLLPQREQADFAKIIFDGPVKMKTESRLFQCKECQRTRTQSAGAAIRSMEFNRAILSAKCLAVIRTESGKARDTETGGPLVGYVSKDGTMVVADAGAPGPRAKLERYSVTIDGEHAQRFCGQINRESEGLMDYVGDWHKHTGISLRPSKQDVSAMKIMADFEFSPTRHPISLIYRKWPQALQIYVWDGSGGLTRIQWKIIPS
jgi:integrative and conjugative element protein (TIGR02256 family)